MRVEQGHPLECGVLDVFDPAPRSIVVNDFGLEEPLRFRPRSISRLHDVAASRLSGAQSLGVVLRAIDLAIVLGDADLRQIVSAVAKSSGSAFQYRKAGLDNGIGGRDYAASLSGSGEKYIWSGVRSARLECGRRVLQSVR